MGGGGKERKIEFSIRFCILILDTPPYRRGPLDKFLPCVQPQSSLLLIGHSLPSFLHRASFAITPMDLANKFFLPELGHGSLILIAPSLITAEPALKVTIRHSL